MAPRRKWFRFSRDTAMFIVGLAGIGYETLVSKVERPSLLIIFAAMIGLPAFLRKDEANSPNTSAAVIKAVRRYPRSLLWLVSWGFAAMLWERWR